MRNLVGKHFGRLEVLRLSRIHHGTTPAGKPRSCACWWVRCSCGVEKEVRASNLISGQIVSCGCGKRGLRTASPPR